MGKKFGSICRKMFIFGVEGGLGIYTSYIQMVNEWLEVVNGYKNGDGVSSEKRHNIAIV